MHECPVRGCQARVSDGRLMCRVHWPLVPRRLATELRITWRDRQADPGNHHLQELHIGAVAAALRVVEQALTPSSEIVQMEMLPKDWPFPTNKS